MKMKMLPISELISLDSSEKRNVEKREKEIFLCVPEIKMKEKRNDSITRQISLNKQFVLPCFEHVPDERSWEKRLRRN
jgi:hypothetical protein